MVQMKAMASELNMYQAQVNEYKYEIEKLNRELQDLKKKYYSQNRKEQLNLDVATGAGVGANPHGYLPAEVMSKTAPLMLQQQQISAAKSARHRFTGGGFAVN